MKPLSQYVTDRGARVLFKGAADVGGKAVTLAITALAARMLAWDAFGVLAMAMATGWLLGVATDAGLSMHLARESARQRRTLRGLLSEVMIVRAGLAYVAATLAALFAGSVVPGQWKLQFVLVVFAQLTAAVLETLAHFFRGIERSEIESAVHVVQRAVTLAASAIVLYLWGRLDYLGVALLIPVAIALVAALVIAFRLTAPDAPAARTARLTARGFVRDVLPLGAGVLLSALYFRCDLYFVERWHGLEAAGGYNAVFRLIEAMRVLPAAVMAVTFPLLVNAADASVVRRIGGQLTMAGIGLAAISAAASPAIVTLVYGAAYAYASTAFAVLAIALPFFFLNYALTHQVIGWDGQRSYLAISAAALAANLAANLALIPARGIVGAAIATILTELVVTAGCVYVLATRAGNRPVGVRYEDLPA